MEYPYVWEPGEEFTQFSTVGHNEKYYTCIIDHVSSNSTEPGVGTNWKTYWTLSSFNYLPKYNQGQDFFFPFFTLPVSAPPVVLSIDPISGPSLGDTNVSVIGQNFTVGSVVFFGTDLAMDIVTINPGLIQCKTPAHNFPVGGAVDVTVINDGGSGSLPSAFTYTPVIPTVISVDPGTGFSCIGKPVTVIGTNFTVGDQVFFDTDLADSIVVVNSTTITCVTPLHAVGTVNVSVTNGTYTGTLMGGFIYANPAPVIGYTTQAMTCLGTQTLTASGGAGGPYTWVLAAGGGTLNPTVGDSVLYTAPVSNPFCNNNPSIYIIDACGTHSATLQIAVNCNLGYPASNAAQVYTSDDIICQPYQADTCACTRRAHTYNCSGELLSSPMAGAGHCGAILLCTQSYPPRVCNSTCVPVNDVADLRTGGNAPSTGCCPPQLLGGITCP